MQQAMQIWQPLSVDVLIQRHACAQTVCNTMMVIEVHLTEDQLRHPDVRDAKVEGIMCPALVELACEALGWSGRHPDGTVRCLPGAGLGPVWQGMQAPVQEQNTHTLAP